MNEHAYYICIWASIFLTCFTHTYSLRSRKNRTIIQYHVCYCYLQPAGAGVLLNRVVCVATGLQIGRSGQRSALGSPSSSQGLSHSDACASGGRRGRNAGRCRAATSGRRAPCREAQWSSSGARSPDADSISLSRPAVTWRSYVCLVSTSR